MHVYISIDIIFVLLIELDESVVSCSSWLHVSDAFYTLVMHMWKI